jgi:hypothetical protein
MIQYQVLIPWRADEDGPAADGEWTSASIEL